MQAARGSQHTAVRQAHHKPLTRPLRAHRATQPATDALAGVPRPAFRAILFPEVTEPLSRLPSPTFTYRLEAANLGNLLRLCVRHDRETRAALASIFTGPTHTRSGRHHEKPLWRSPSPRPASPDNPIPQAPPLLLVFQGAGCQTEKRTLSGACAGVSRRLQRRRVRPRRAPECQPASLSQDRQRCAACFGPARALLRSGSPLYHCGAQGTVFHFSHQGSRLIHCYSHQDLH